MERDNLNAIGILRRKNAIVMHIATLLKEISLTSSAYFEGETRLSWESHVVERNKLNVIGMLRKKKRDLGLPCESHVVERHQNNVTETCFELNLLEQSRVSLHTQQSHILMQVPCGIGFQDKSSSP